MRTTRNLLAIFSLSTFALIGVSCGVEASENSGDTDTEIDVTATTTTPAEGGTVTAEPSEPTTTEADEPTTTEADETTTTEADETTTTEEEDTPSTSPGGDAFRDGLISSFEAAGLTTVQAECVADEFIAAGYTDPSDVTEDAQAVLQIFLDCDVDPTTLGG